MGSSGPWPWDGRPGWAGVTTDVREEEWKSRSAGWVISTNTEFTSVSLHISPLTRGAPFLQHQILRACLLKALFPLTIEFQSEASSLGAQ